MAILVVEYETLDSTALWCCERRDKRARAFGSDLIAPAPRLREA